ncbi:hypothetical protein PANT_9c00291 [Moesziomyces antarcticus T-34]|uniref:Uncharacterized protein n=1 Tax=Pseudozyma antarctica (strain T-34) TaxID=1151754 RepID=M9LP24_PSEA3|nr:hypothetical protein PANT_9c00291 [Moesziomyces antarcticus T-34]
MLTSSCPYVRVTWHVPDSKLEEFFAKLSIDRRQKQHRYYGFTNSVHIVSASFLVGDDRVDFITNVQVEPYYFSHTLQNGPEISSSEQEGSGGVTDDPWKRLSTVPETAPPEGNLIVVWHIPDDYLWLRFHYEEKAYSHALDYCHHMTEPDARIHVFAIRYNAPDLYAFLQYHRRDWFYCMHSSMSRTPDGCFADGRAGPGWNKEGATGRTAYESTFGDKYIGDLTFVSIDHDESYKYLAEDFVPDD